MYTVLVEIIITYLIVAQNIIYILLILTRNWLVLCFMVFILLAAGARASSVRYVCLLNFRYPRHTPASGSGSPGTLCSFASLQSYVCSHFSSQNQPVQTMSILCFYDSIINYLVHIVLTPSLALLFA